MATSSSTAYAVPRKARFACKRCYEGSPELFSAGEGYSLNCDLSVRVKSQKIIDTGARMVYNIREFRKMEMRNEEKNCGII